MGAKVFFDKTLSGSGQMSCASCHDPSYAYGAPNSLAVQLGGPALQSIGFRSVPSLRYKDMIPPYSDQATNPDGVSLPAPGGGFMWDGRVATLPEQPALPLLNPVEMANTSQAAVVQAIQNGSYAALFQQAFGTNALTNVATAFADVGQALAAYQTEDPSFHPYTSKLDLYLDNKIGGTLTAAETRGLGVFIGNINGNTDGNLNCVSCHYAGANFNGANALMTDFTYEALSVPRNDNSIPNNAAPISANQDPTYYDMGICGPYRTDHTPSIPYTAANAANDLYAQYCGLFKTAGLRNVGIKLAFFHNGVFQSLDQVLHFYNTRDTNPEYWYPSSGGSGTVVNNPAYALQPTYTPGATIRTFNDLPAAYQGNIDEEVPMGQGPDPNNPNAGNTASSGALARAFHSTPFMTEQNIADLECFLNTLTDSYVPPATTPATGTCVN